MFRHRGSIDDPAYDLHEYGLQDENVSGNDLWIGTTINPVAFDGRKPAHHPCRWESLRPSIR